MPEEELKLRPGLRFRATCRACATPFSVVWRDDDLITEVEEVLQEEGDDRDVLLRGTRIGKYEIEDLIDSGGSSSVYKAFEGGANRYVALKVLHRPADADFGMRFRREVEVQGNLKHPNLMPIFDHGEVEGKPFYTMELLHKPTTLETVGSLFRSGRLGFNPSLRSLNSVEALVRHILLPVARAIDFANREHGIIHRDLKPDNVLLDARTLRVYVIDFGICHVFQQSGSRLLLRAAARETVPATLETPRMLAMGAVRYMPPEQARGQVSRQGDVWALGALLRFLITGDAAIAPALDLQRVTIEKRIANLARIAASCRESGDQEDAAFYEARLAELRAGEIRTLKDVLRDAQDGHYLPLPVSTDSALAAVVQRAMALDPEDRYPSAGDFAADLVAWLEGRPVRAFTATLRPWTAAAHGTRLFLKRNRTAVLTAAGALLVALAVGAVLFAGAASREQREIEGWLAEARRHADPQAQQALLERVLARRPDHDEALELRGLARAFLPILAKVEEARRVSALIADLQKEGRAEEREEMASDMAAVLERSVLPDLLALPENYAGRAIEREARSLAAFLRGRRILSFLSVPRGVEVIVVPPRSRADPEPDWPRQVSWGVAPLGEPERFCEPGSYAVLFRREGDARTIQLPVRITRSTPQKLEVRCPLDPAKLPEGMVFVSGGKGLVLGDPRFQEGTRRVDLEDFLMDANEVTNQMYAVFVNSLEPSQRRAVAPRRLSPGGGSAIPLWSEDGKGRWLYSEGAGDHPVTGISFLDARAYAAFLGKRLPTPDEWERAARGLDDREYPFGSRLDPKACNAHTGSIAPVGTFARDRSPFGAVDMAGNVAEWTDDAAETEMATVKGGSFDLPRFHAIVSASRARRADLPAPDLGFRCAVPLAEADR